MDGPQWYPRYMSACARSLASSTVIFICMIGFLFYPYTQLFDFWPFFRFRTSGHLPENPARATKPVQLRRGRRHDGGLACTLWLTFCFQILVKLPANHVEFILPVKIIMIDQRPFILIDIFQ